MRQRRGRNVEGNTNADALDSVRLRLQQCVSVAMSERDAICERLSVLVARAHVMEAARVADWYAPKVSPFDFGVEGEAFGVEGEAGMA